ncbi:preprotein translocase subunit SecA [Candidatus Giovannonibacteria bacterium]|nr:preprotein translocase subunit SecA [Candidatus Giovannonibacteria bacterium]
MSILTKIFGDPNARVISTLQPVVDEINSLEPEFEKFSDEELKGKTTEFRRRLEASESLDDILPDAFAAVREASKRTLGQRHYDVQLMGGITLHRGQIAEMKTGEGKTLVATLPLYLNALTGEGTHLVTVNDYLARRDATWMGQIYNALGLTTGVLNHEASYIYDPSHSEKDSERDKLGSFKVVHEFLRPVTRHEAYAADITYGTNNEYGFDYLRDNMVYALDKLSQRVKHSYAIVDEVDSILIDEARTPLIISAPDAESGELYKTFSKIVPRLKEKEDYNIDEKMKAATITEEGIEKVEGILGVSDIYTEKGMRYVHHLEQALRAEVLFQRDRDYIIKNGEVIIVDEFTGRLMPGRRWSEGLHQAIEAKEGVDIQKESRTLATITFQNYFRLYKKLAGMTGTASTSSEEFHKVYGLEVVPIPTNKTLVRQDLPDKIFQSETGKWKALVRDVKERYEKGQPVLIGTVSIEKNEKLSAMLGREGIAHRVLNAKHHEEEAMIISQAGKAKAVTVATNMAGRGVDIILGGNPPSADEAEQVRGAGGLLVLGTERHEARRIDNQLRGRAGRQGDPGESRFYVSMEDDLMRIFGSEKIKNLMGRFGVPEDEPIENKMVSRALESAQERIEGYHFDARKHVLEYDDVMNKQRISIYSRRKKLLFSENPGIENEVKDIFNAIVSKMVEMHTASGSAEEWNRKEIENDISALAGELNAEAKEKFSALTDPEELKEALLDYLDSAYSVKKETVPNYSEEVRYVILQAIDILWMEHIEAMDYMRSSVRLRAYGNRDPLIEYKNEGARMFNILGDNINAYIANLILKIGSGHEGHVHVHRQENSPKLIFHSAKNEPAPQNVKTRPPAGGSNTNSEIGRNDPCPCGAVNPITGRPYKFKQCGLINAPHHKG